MKGSGGDLGTLTEQEPGGAAAGPAARPGRRLPGGGARGRDGRRVRLLPARQGRRRPVDRHRDARAGRRRARRPPAPGLRDRAGHRRRRGEADRASASATGWCGCRGGAPASSSAWTSPRSRRRTRRPSAASSAGTASPPGATPASRPRRTRWRSSAPPSSSSPTTAPPNRSAPVVPGYEAAAGGGAAGEGRRALPDDPRASPRRTGRRSGTTPTPTWCWSSCPGRSSPRWPSWARPARTTSCAPRSSRWSSTCPPTASVEEILARLPELHEAYRADYQGYYDRNADPGLPGDARRGPGDRAGPRRRACSPSARTSRPPGSPASSTSTRST